MKLNAKISSEKASRTVSKSGDEYINVELNVKNHKIGSIELYLIDDISEGFEADEWLLKFYHADEYAYPDPHIIKRGNL